MEEWVEHLEELRRRIIAVLVVFFAAAVAAFVFSSHIAAFLIAPLDAFQIQLYAFAPTDIFMAYMRLAFWTGAVFTAPFFCLQTWLFLRPGLRGNEHRYAAAVLFVVPVLFFLGAGLSYRFMAPMVFGFFLFFGAGDGIEALWSFKEYLALLFNIMIASGLLLQFPLAVFALIVTGVVSAARVAHYRCHVIFLIFLAAALVTPPDVISQIMLGVPLYLLFEAVLWLGGMMRRQ